MIYSPLIKNKILYSQGLTMNTPSKLFAFVLFIFLPQILFARPEYIIKHRITRCTGCHISPVGGGVRNIYGKSYGARNHQLTKYGKQDFISLDVRTMFLGNETVKAKGGGMGVMGSHVSANVVLQEMSPDSGEARLVVTHGLGSFKDVSSNYLRYKTYEDSQHGILPQYYLVGRFHSPYGLITDEHRTYTKMQTNTHWVSYETGVLMSGDPFDQIHYDLALVNGTKHSSGLTNYTLWGSNINIRVSPQFLPIVFGISGQYHDKGTDDQTGADNSDPYAYAEYIMASLTSFGLPLTFLLEHSTAQYWNASLGGSPNFGDGSKAPLLSETDSISEAYWAQVSLDITERLTVLYKYDSLALDRDFKGDVYTRHGVGIKYTIFANTIIQARMEKAKANNNLEEKSTAMSNEDAFFMLLQMSI